MAEKINVVSMGVGMSDWKASLVATGTAIYDIHFELGATLRGRYYLHVDGEVRRDGTFEVQAWDGETVRELLTTLLRSDYPGAEIDVSMPQLPALRRRA